MKTTLDLPDELVREMKLRALMQGRTLRDLATDFLRQGLGWPRPSPPLSCRPIRPFKSMKTVFQFSVVAITHLHDT